MKRFNFIIKFLINNFRLVDCPRTSADVCRQFHGIFVCLPYTFSRENPAEVAGCKTVSGPYRVGNLHLRGVYVRYAFAVLEYLAAFSSLSEDNGAYPELFGQYPDWFRLSFAEHIGDYGQFILVELQNIADFKRILDYFLFVEILA